MTIKFTVLPKISIKYSPDLVVYLLLQKEKEKTEWSELPYDSLQCASRLGDFQGKEKEILLTYEKNEIVGGRGNRIAFVGTGIMQKTEKENDFREKMRIVGGHVAKLCRKVHAKKVCLVPPSMLLEQEKEAVYCLTEGIILGDYTFTKYKTEKKKTRKFDGIREVKFLIENNLKRTRNEVSLAVNAANAACEARNMANEPGNIWTSESFATYAGQLAEKYQLKCNILDKAAMETMGMGGILAVNRGSAIPPKLVVLEYHCSRNAATILLVGKGLTFDTGGVSLKPAAGMEDMKYDMCGGAAVLAVMNAVGIEKPGCNVIAIVPATDNMPGSSALKPGDIIFHYNTMSSEIVNTDAEGRLILADALAYGIDTYHPDCVVDLATLTGAVITGLGHHYSGLLSNDDSIAQRLIDAGMNTGEVLWRLPLGAPYAKQIESKIADMKNTGGKAAGTCTAAEYLHKFVKKTPWAHIDIAGTAWGGPEKSYTNDNGPSGTGTRLLIDFIRNWKKNKRSQPE